MTQGSKKIILSILVICFAGSIVFGSLVVPQKAYAISDAWAIIAGSVKNTAQWTRNWIKNMKDAFKTEIQTKLISSAVEIFAQNMAIKTAESIVSGNRGQGSLLEGRVFQDILKDAAGAAAGDYIGNLSESWVGLGINLCEPSLDIKVVITMSLLKSVQPPKPKCDLADIVKNWDRFIEDYDLDNLKGKNLSQAMSGVLSGLNVSFKPGRSDFSAAVTLNNELQGKISKKEEIAKAEAAKSSYVPKVNETNTQVETPPEISEDAKEMSDETVTNAKQTKDEVAANSKSSILGRALSTFTNTLTAKLINKWLAKGFSNLTKSKNRQIAIDSSGTSGVYDSSVFRQGSISSQARSDYYSDLAVVTFGDPEEYDPLADFTVCPTNKDMIELNNCVMSSKFYAAFNRGEPITLKEAINLKLIDPNLPLINKDSTQHSDLQYCYKEALCYSNLQKMRLARLIPLGWEIAADKSSVDDPATLQEVINAFNDPTSQYYKLIDSDWVLKAPLAQCRAQGYGPRLQSKYDVERSEICVDTQTCLQEADDGSCLPGAWGYCTREENVWRFGGDQCNEAFASCRGFTNQNGTSYFIKDTVDFCGADEVGCQSYSTQKDDEGNWIDALIYLNNQAGTCEGQNAGCSELIKTEPGINLLLNGGFESGDEGWHLDEIEAANGDSGVTSEKVFAGNNSAKLVNTAGQTFVDSNAVYWWSPVIAMPSSVLNKTVSVSGQYVYDGPGYVRLYLFMYPENWNGTDYNDDGPTFSDDDSTAHHQHVEGLDNDDNWHSLSETVDVGEETAFVRIRMDLRRTGDNVGDIVAYFDNLQIELGANITPYKPYGQYNLTYLKKAPDYLNCDNSTLASNDCYQYAPVCEASEVGCELYTPVSGDPAVPGKVSAGDYCNEECNNYQSYAQMVTPIEAMFDPVVPASRDFIYDSAQQCSLAAIGCEEFTDISNSENRMYYNGLRMCVTADNPNIGVYYTWEGSDTTGYQLKVWQLLQSNVDDGPCTNIQYNDTLGQNVCTDDVVEIDDCAGVPNAPSCRNYVDSDNNQYTRREAKVIKASDSCTKLRRTKGNDIAIILPEESNSCAAVEVGCHEYKGNNGSNIRRVFLDDFESALAGWTGDPSPTLSTEASITGGHSMKINNAVVTRPAVVQVNKSYTISFWAKTNGDGDNPLNIFLINNNNDSIDFVDSNAEEYYSEWTYYQYGPASVSADFDLTDVKVGIDFNDTTYWIDNIILKEITKDIYIIEDSWFIPLSCVEEDNSQLGCQEYNDRAGNIHYLMSFSSICGEDKVGCTEFVDTHNSDSPFEQIWSVEYDGAGNTTPITVAADNIVYFVDDSQYYCAASNKGCTELGWQNQSTEQWYDVYLKSDPDNYDLSLCGFNGIGCDVYASEGKEVYLRDPGDNTCVYLENYERNGSIATAGWYQTSSLEEDDLVACAEGLSLPKRREDSWTGTVGLCQVEYDGCTEFIDPHGTQGDNLLYNGEFEINTNPNTAPDFWGDATTNGFIDWSNNSGRDNSGGVRVQYYNAGNHGDRFAFKQNVEIKAKTEYVVSFDAKNVNSPLLYLDLDCSEPILSYDNSLGESFPYNFESGQRYTVQRMFDLVADQFVTYNAKFSLASAGNCDIALGGAAGQGEAPYLDNVKVQELKSYYYINDENISGVDCNGQVSWDKGCILILDTANVSYDTGEIIRSYNSSATYRNSDSSNGYLVSTIGCEADDQSCDANRIVRVTRDRECAEWIQCQSSSKATQMDGITKEYCYDLGRCTELSLNGSTCVNWLEKDAQVITDTVYQNRDIGWSGKEYSGYSLFNRYNIEDLLAKTKSQGNSNILVLSREDNDSSGIDGTGLKIEPTCRLFPDAEAPYATTGLNVVFDDDGNIVERPLEMTQANFCYQGEDCECDYQKVTYSGGEARYYDLKYSGVPQTLSYPGYDLDDLTDDYSSYLTGINKYKGFWGFCLEPDYSRRISGYVDPNYQANSAAAYPCTTWMPLDILSGEYNPSAVDIEADLGIDFDSLYYCSQAEGNYPYTGEQVISTSFNLGTNAVESQKNAGGSSWFSNSCGLLNNIDNNFPQNNTDYPDNTTMAICAVDHNMNLNMPDRFITSISGEELFDFWVYPSLAIDEVRYTIMTSGGYFTSQDNIIGYQNTAPDNLPYLPRLPEYYCSEGQSCGDGSPIVTVDSTNEVICDGSVHSDLCKVGESKIWIRIFAVPNYIVPGDSMIFPMGDDGAWWEGIRGLTQNPNIVYLVNADEFFESGFGTYSEGLLMSFIVGFDDDGNSSRYEIVLSQEHEGSNYNVLSGFLYNITVDHYNMDTTDTELCTEFVRVESPKFNNFIYETSENFMPQGQYNDWYGISELSGIQNLNNYNNAISVEPVVDNYISHNAGTPYSVFGDDSEISKYSWCVGGDSICQTASGQQACYAGGGRCYGLDMETPEATKNIINTNSLSQVYGYLQNIFAKLVSKFTWGDGSYTETSFNNTYNVTNDGEVMQVKEVVWDESSLQNIEGNDGITINNQQSGDIVYNGNSFNTTLKFYAYNESGNQLPLKHLVIDWDDSTALFGADSNNVPIDVALKNHQQICENSCLTSLVDDGAFISGPNGWSGLASAGLGDSGSDNYLGARFNEGEMVTLEFNYTNNNNVPLPVYWCYDAEDCSQEDSNGYENQGQTQVYPTLNFADLPATTSGTYKSSMIITSEMINGCYNINNPSGYCLKDLALGHLQSAQEVTIDIIGLYFGCRTNNDCQYTKFGGDSLGECQPTDVGDDLNYCVDDVGGGIGYFSFNHTYICDDPIEQYLGQEACVYTPKVYVEDSWGWCSEGYGESECSITDNSGLGWINYNGSIILTP